MRPRPPASTVREDRLRGLQIESATGRTLVVREDLEANRSVGISAVAARLIVGELFRFAACFASFVNGFLTLAARRLHAIGGPKA